ncbi:hypothetical protein PGT21_013329 [Puccinia graminis f. sp. tritici]|uniref:Uncharacterized protein n=1 Tax=Puccinia graminis f. sp. tritici TaxID=56615 RepID=A0A5B0QFB4_PUCGR|nr:hypothetical protein PGT21_013329 [Puccinia graminis f. sp. tritici]
MSRCIYTSFMIGFGFFKERGHHHHHHHQHSRSKKKKKKKKNEKARELHTLPSIRGVSLPTNHPSPSDHQPGSVSLTTIPLSLTLSLKHSTLIFNQKSRTQNPNITQEELEYSSKTAQGEREGESKGPPNPPSSSPQLGPQLPRLEKTFIIFFIRSSSSLIFIPPSIESSLLSHLHNTIIHQARSPSQSTTLFPPRELLPIFAISSRIGYQ